MAAAAEEDEVVELDLAEVVEIAELDLTEVVELAELDLAELTELTELMERAEVAELAVEGAAVVELDETFAAEEEEVADSFADELAETRVAEALLAALDADLVG